MLGAIAGDIIGSIYEGKKADRKDFPLFSANCRFTDDTVLTVATADALLSNSTFGEKYGEYCRLYPYAGYGSAFKKWGASLDPQPYNSFGNGSAMRVSPIAHAYDDINSVMTQAEHSAECTHNHPQGIKGAQAIAAAIFYARLGFTKDAIRGEIEGRFDYDLSASVNYLHRYYQFDVTCQGSVPQALIAFLEAENFEDAIRNSIYIGGDSDTIACMAGAIAEAFYGEVPTTIRDYVFRILDGHLAEVTRRFAAKYLTDFHY